MAKYLKMHIYSKWKI